MPGTVGGIIQVGRQMSIHLLIQPLYAVSSRLKSFQSLPAARILKVEVSFFPLFSMMCLISPQKF